MKDFDKRLAEFGHHQQIHREGVQRFILNQPSDKQKPRCEGVYPYCVTAMNIHYHTQTSSRAEPGTIRLQCKICGKGGIVNAHQWCEDVIKSKKSS